ncbi:MAG: response regulator transcription factor [Candidatus Omnitrophota bacterium]
MAGKDVLIVEDDKNISRLVKYNLERAGFCCVIRITGEDALEALEREPVDLIILDLMLPKMDGIEVLKIIKQDKRLRSVPLIVLTAKGEEIDRIVGFELGADDYVVKPFSPRELVLRVKAVMRRARLVEPDEKEILGVGNLTVDIPRHKVTSNNKHIRLTAMEFNLLVVLIRRRGKVQSRDRLLEDVWDIAADVTTRTIDTHIKRLRQKLGRAGRFIETVRGIGYCFRDDG